MGDTWLIDMTHYLDVANPAVDLHPATRRLAEYFGAIVSAATVWPFAGIPMDSAVACRRRPRRRPCPGHIRLVQQRSGDIHWACTECDDHGFIHHWQGTPWDLTRGDDVDPHLDRGPRHRFLLTDKEHQALRNMHTLDRESERLVMGALHTPDGILLEGLEADIELLAECIAAEANHEKPGPYRRRLDAVYEKLEALLR